MSAPSAEEQRRHAAEQARIIAEYQRRDSQPGTRYGDADPAAVLERTERRRWAERLLREAGVFPGVDCPCLEVGCGAIGWGGELRAWGVAAEKLHGIDISAERIAQARLRLPDADLRVGDGSALPWPAGAFRLVVASTLLTSVLDPAMRQAIAGEMVRVLTPGGAVLWYDFAFNNPRNPHVRKVDRRELRSLFPELRGTVRSLTLAPPIARLIAPRSVRLASVLARLRPLQTHLLAVLVKPH